MFVRWRPVHLGLLFLQVLWLNVVLPGHQRGLVLLPGPAISNQHCHRQKQANPCCKHDRKSDNSDRKARCAVCSFAARLTVPPAPVFAPTLLELRPEIASAKLEALLGSDLPPAYWSRGPPLA